MGEVRIRRPPYTSEPEAFKVVAALDLVMMVPALTMGGFLLWRRQPWGYVVATMASIQATLYQLVLSVNAVVAIRRGLMAAPGELPIWGMLLLLMTAVALALLANAGARTDQSGRSTAAVLESHS